MLHLQSFKYFAEVAKTGSLRQASETLLVAPSAISRQIANLEQTLGTPLFERSFRGMVPTEAGRILLNFVNGQNVRIDRMRSNIDDLSFLKRGTVRLAAVEAVTANFLPELLNDFGRQFPGIDFHITVCGTHQIAQRIASDTADIGMAFNVLSREDLILHGRNSQPLQMICRPGHPLASRHSISMADLDGMRVALPDSTFGIRYMIDHVAAQAKITLSVGYEANSLQLIKAIVCGTDLVSFMPPLTFAREATLGSLHSVNLSDRTLRQSSIDIITASDRKLSVAARAFLDKLLLRIRAC